MLNETIMETINALTPTGMLWWMKWLMIAGAFWILSTLVKTGINLVYAIAYLVGGIIFIVNKIRGKEKVGA